MLGDVVGLGKTLTAVATALMLQAAEDYSTLVLCPKNLQPMWERAPRGVRPQRPRRPVLHGGQGPPRTQAVQPRDLR